GGERDQGRRVRDDRDRRRRRRVPQRRRGPRRSIPCGRETRLVNEVQTMKKPLVLTAFAFAASGAAALTTQAPQSPPQQPPATADPYANNAAPGTTGFPLAAPAGKDSNARAVAPPGAVNTGPFDPATWKRGTAFDPPAGSKIWNPVKLKMLQGGKVTGGTLFSATDPSTYCAMANAGYDFIWTEMQHDQHDWQAVARMWRTCPRAKAGPRLRVASTRERDIHPPPH